MLRDGEIGQWCTLLAHYIQINPTQSKLWVQHCGKEEVQVVERLFLPSLFSHLDVLKNPPKPFQQ